MSAPENTTAGPAVSQEVGPGDPPVAKGFVQYVKSMGPGIVVALSWVGTGDLIDNSVAGGNYGYALLWVLPLSLIFRFVFVDMLGRYVLFNTSGDPSIVRGFGRLHPAYRWLLLISFGLYTHILMAFTLSGVGIALDGLTGDLMDPFWWSVIGALSVFVVAFKGAYKPIELIFKIILAVMSAAFLVGIVMVGVDGGALAQGFAFDLPENSGLFASGLVASSLVLATLGSMANLFYPQFLAEKGWTKPAYRRMQRYDLLFGTFIVLFLGVAIWAIGAEVLHGNNQGVEEASDIAAGLAGAIGPIGTYIFYVGLLGAAWTTVAGSIFALAKMSVESMWLIKPGREDRYAGRAAKDPVYKGMIAWGLLAVFWSLPGAPGFIVLVVVSHVLTAPFLLLIVVGLMFIMNRKDMMGANTNSWKQNIGLAIVGILVAAAMVQGLSDAVKDITG